MGTLNEKAGTFLLTAIQAAGDVKRIVEERVRSLLKEAMTPYDAELAAIRERLDDLEKAVKPPRARPAAATKEPAPRPKKARRRRKPATKPTEPATKTGPSVEPRPPATGPAEPAAE